MKRIAWLLLALPVALFALGCGEKPTEEGTDTDGTDVQIETGKPMEPPTTDGKTDTGTDGTTDTAADGTTDTGTDGTTDTGTDGTTDTGTDGTDAKGGTDDGLPDIDIKPPENPEKSPE